MKKPISIVLRVVVFLALLAVVGRAAFGIGYARGVTESPAIAEQVQSWQNKTDNVPGIYAFPGYAGPMMRGGYSPLMMQRGHFGFNPIAGFLGFLFLAFVFFGVMRLVFFRRMMHNNEPWHGHMPPWVQQQPAPQSPAQPEPPQTENK
ncbi:MAG: hypothetical protein ACOYXO_10375 [Chloroflexota bacterium]|jgi:putative copper export protein